MTIIKQQSVTDGGHQKHLRDYINNDRKVLLRDSQNMAGCRNLKQWASWMSATRDRFGHNKASRRVRDKETGELVDAKNTILYHQILAFLPDECDVNGGKLSPEDCMAYAKQYTARYYPNQQIVYALHKEHCKEDATYRYAIHMVINRSDLATGKRLDEGTGAKAKRERAGRVRKMDERWGLKQVVEGERNSAVHKKQPGKIEKGIAARGGKSYKTNLRELCRIAASRATNLVEYREMLEEWGVDTQFRRGRLFVTDSDNARYSFSVRKLDADLGQDGLEKSFRTNIVNRGKESGKQGIVDVQEMRTDYLAHIKETYVAYRRTVLAMGDAPMSDIPKLKLHRPPAGISDDPEVKRTILAYWRGGDELRAKMASDAPRSRKAIANRTDSNVQTAKANQPRQTEERPTRHDR